MPLIVQKIFLSSIRAQRDHLSWHYNLWPDHSVNTSFFFPWKNNNETEIPPPPTKAFVYTHEIQHAHCITEQNNWWAAKFQESLGSAQRKPLHRSHSTVYNFHNTGRQAALSLSLFQPEKTAGYFSDDRRKPRLSRIRNPSIRPSIDNCSFAPRLS